MSYHTNIENDTMENDNYRKVVHTVPNKLQLVLMSIPAGQDIPMEIHPKVTQFIKIVKGLGIATIDDVLYGLGDETAIIIEPCSYHRIENVGDEPLKLYTIYTPPEHPVGLVQKDKLR